MAEMKIIYCFLPRIWRGQRRGWRRGRITVVKLLLPLSLSLSMLTLWFYSSNTYKLYPLKLHYNLKTFWGKSTCIDIKGEPTVGLGTDRLWIDSEGRLGNCIFNFISGFALAKKNNQELMLAPRLAYYIQDTFDIKSEGLFGICPVSEHINLITVPFAKYQSKLENTQSEGTHVCCFLQSWKYFEKYEDEVRGLLKFHDILIDRAQQFLYDERRRVNSEGRFRSETSRPRTETVFIGVHVRHGDMFAGHHVRIGYQTAPLTYLISSVEYFIERFRHVHFIVCSDDIMWCRGQDVFHTRDMGPKSYAVSFSEGFSEGFDLALLSQCNHTIMTVGTFGWWGGWLAGGDVVYYKQPIKPGSVLAENFNSDDFYPPHWIGMM